MVGITLGLMTARLPFLRAALDPVVLTAGTIPILVTAPFFLIWFGTSRAAQVALLVLYGVTIIYLFAQRAVANLNPIYLAAGRTMGADTQTILVDVYLKGTLPEVFGGIRIALAGSWGLEAFSSSWARRTASAASSRRWGRAWTPRPWSRPSSRSLSSRWASMC